MNPVKLGIIGCGIAAKDLHWPALQKLRDKFEITLVCNRTEPKAREFADMVGDASYVLDYRELLDSEEVEAVDIVLPITLNYQVTQDALEAGKHVIVEKPLAANLADAKRMLDFENRYPEVKMVAENFRYHEVLLRTKAYLEEGRIGQPYAIFWNIFRRIEESNKYAQTEWRIHHQYPGGFITDAGIHNVAALRVFFGEITSLSAFTKSINRNIGEIDSLSFQFATESDVHGVLNIFFSVRGYSESRFFVLGSEGTIRVENNRKILMSRNGEVELEEEIQTDHGYRGEFEDFYQAIRFDQNAISSFAQAFRDLEVMLKALESANR